MASRRPVLVTGGAGYVGSHALRLLHEAGYAAVAYDDLSTGFPWAVVDAELVVGSLAERERLSALLAQRRFSAVLHFAAHVRVEESVSEPAKYYRNNVVNALGLFELAARHGVTNVVFSSSCAVYGEPPVVPIDETTPLAPINPYGASKMMAERMLHDIAAACGPRYVILRYFNVAGADPEARIGQATLAASQLIKVGCATALGQRLGQLGRGAPRPVVGEGAPTPSDRSSPARPRRPAMQIFGTDYPTPDGTCVRDYIHVDDVARAHLDALRYLEDGGASTVLNCGYGHGHSVREVVDSVRRVTGIDFPVEERPRRPGDPSTLVASNRKIREVLGWQPRHDDLEYVVRTAWHWEQRLHACGGPAAFDRSLAAAPTSEAAPS